MRSTLAAAIVAGCLFAAATAAHGGTPPAAPATQICQSTLPNFIMPPPTLYAADVSSGQDWQYVAWRPNIWYWNGSTWARAAQGQWLWSWAFDSSPATYWYDYSGRYVGTTTKAQGSQVTERFNVTGLGYYYLISNEFYWYPRASGPEAYNHVWANDYAGDDVFNSFCYF